MKTTLPASPAKKAAVLESLVSSPRTRKQLEKRGVVTTPEEQRGVAKLKALASDISSGLAKVIKKSRAKRSLGKLVNLNEKNISKAIKRRESILKGDTPSWLYTKRKVRQDAISEEDAKKVFSYWAHTASRPTGDKKDVLKQHIGKEEHVKHTKHVLEKMQTDAFREFLELHSEVKIRQRKFESLKPFFVKQAKERDRRSCLCRKHVEMQIVFKSCMKYRKELVKKSANIDESFVIKRVTEAAEKTLCPKPEGINYHNIKCLERECTECGVDNIEFLPEETSGEVTVSWSRYEYVSTGKFVTNGQEKKKIALVQKEAPPSELFGYFKELLVEYPRHSFMARWQREQLDSLLGLCQTA